jgi:hypothetical protein
MKGTDAKGANGTTIKRCNCASEYQDKQYGSGMRVFNLKANTTTGTATCTVCGRRS